MSQQSKSEKHWFTKSAIPSVTPEMAKQVSTYRREQLAKDLEQGIFRQGSAVQQPAPPNKLGVVSGAKGVKKTAQAYGSNSSVAGGGFRGPGDTVKQAPGIYSPLWLNSNLSLPRDRATINAWCRSFFVLNPFVHNAISLHSTYPISKLSIRCSNKEVEKFFNNMIEELDLMNICVQIAQEYFLLGEAFVYAEMDESRGVWNRLLIQNPDYMVVHRTVASSEPTIMLRPDENLKKIVFSNKPSDIEQRKQLNPYIVNAVKRGQNIPLDNYHVSHLARRVSPYEMRGTGLPVTVFRQLCLFDTLRESKFAQADGGINPLTLVKIGSNGPDGLHPTHADLEAWREVFAQAAHDPDYKIFSHADLVVEKVGNNSGTVDISGDITQLIKEIFVGLMVPSVIMDGQDITYANGGVAMDVLRQRYMQFRNMLSTWLKRKIFAPISKIQEFYEYVDGEKQLIIPEIDWNHMTLFDAGDYIGNLVNLTQGEGSAKRASLHTLYRSLGLEFEDEVRKMRKEAIQEAILEKEKASLKTMDLNALRALGDDDEIPEPEEEGGGEGGSGGEPGDMPGLPSMPDMPGLDIPPPALPDLPPS